VSSEQQAGAADLYEAFSKWGGKIPKSPFGKALAEREFVSDRFTAGPHKGRRCWKGIGLLEARQE
jgi:hypothetical protein